MKITNIFSDSHRTSAQKAKEKDAREMFKDWKPGPEELLASGKWKGPIIVEGQQDFWEAIRRVRELRLAKGLTLKDVSQRCGIDVPTLSKLENGKQTNPTLFTMLLYVGAVGQQLHFSVQPKPQPDMQVSEIRHPKAPVNGTGQPRGEKIKVAQKARVGAKAGN